METTRPFPVSAGAASGTARPGALFQQLGCLMLVGCVGMREAGAIMSRHCSPRAWQRNKRQLRTLKALDAGGFIALKQVDEALERIEPLRLGRFQEPPTGSSMTGKSR